MGAGTINLPHVHGMECKDMISTETPGLLIGKRGCIDLTRYITRPSSGKFLANGARQSTRTVEKG